MGRRQTYRFRELFISTYKVATESRQQVHNSCLKDLEDEVVQSSL